MTGILSYSSVAREVMRNQQRLSLCIVVYNEEKIIRRCLDSIISLVDEVILVHDGPCADSTLDIARSYGQKVRIFVRPKIGEAEPHRAFTFKQARGDWVISLDPDEIVSTKLAAKIPHYIQSATIDAYAPVWPIWDGQRVQSFGWPHRPILFRRSKMSYLAFPHQLPRSSGTIKDIPEILEHQPTYNNYTLERFWRKQRHWAKIQARLTLKDFSEIDSFNDPLTDWPNPIRFMRTFPILFIPFAIASFFASIPPYSILRRQNNYAWRSALLWGGYCGLVYYYVLLMKLRLLKQG